MRPRDIVLVSAVLLVGGFAVADALRGDAEKQAPPPTARSLSEAETETGEPVETIRLAGPDVLTGRLVFSDEACRVRELDLARGELAAFAPVQSTCSIVGALGPRDGGPRVAVALPSPRRDVLPYRVLDLARSDPHVLGFRARTRSVVWDSDGSRVGWCDENGRGQEVELGGDPRPLSDCPAAYTASGARVYVRGRRLLSETTTILSAPSEVEALSFAPDGSVAVAAGGTLLVLYGRLGDGSLVEERRVALPAGLRHLRTLFSPTHCHAALLSGEFPPSPTVFVVDLRRCPGSVAPMTFSGRAAAWSPDGTRLAVAERRRVVAQPVFSGEPAVVLAFAATDLAWRP